MAFERTAVEPRIVLGIDPGTHRTGWAIVEPDGPRFRNVHTGVISSKEETLDGRLLEIYRGVVEVIEKFKPTDMAVENIFFARFPQAALKLGHVRGVVMLAAAGMGLPVAEYPPALVKRAITGRGRADKSQVAKLLAALCGWRTLPPVDATDALAVALTHARMQPMLGSQVRTRAASKSIAK